MPVQFAESEGSMYAQGMKIFDNGLSYLQGGILIHPQYDELSSNSSIYPSFHEEAKFGLLVESDLPRE